MIDVGNLMLFDTVQREKKVQYRTVSKVRYEDSSSTATPLT